MAVVFIASCTNDENGCENSDNGQAEFSATINGTETRAVNAQWEANDLIGISGASASKVYSNIAYKTASANGNFSVVTSGTEIYYLDDNAVNFTSYYPRTDLAAGETIIDADTKKQSDQKSFDFLFAKGTGSKASPAVAFAFSHKMAKLALTIKKGANVSYDEVKKAVLTLEGFKAQGTFNTADGTTATNNNETTLWDFANNTNDSAFNAPLTKDDAKETVTYSLIVFPQEFSKSLPIYAKLTGAQTFGATLDFTVANRNAGDNTPKNNWVAGRQYNLSVTLNGTGLSVNGCDISDWTQANGGNYNAEQ